MKRFRFWKTHSDYLTGIFTKLKPNQLKAERDIWLENRNQNVLLSNIKMYISKIPLLWFLFYILQFNYKLTFHGGELSWEHFSYATWTYWHRNESGLHWFTPVSLVSFPDCSHLCVSGTWKSASSNVTSQNIIFTWESTMCIFHELFKDSLYEWTSKPFAFSGFFKHLNYPSMCV